MERDILDVMMDDFQEVQTVIRRNIFDADLLHVPILDFLLFQIPGCDDPGDFYYVYGAFSMVLNDHASGWEVPWLAESDFLVEYVLGDFGLFGI